jgi:hypothetical protein
MLKAPEFKQSKTTQLIYEMMVHASQSKIKLVTWIELQDATGKSRDDISGSLQTAMRRMISDHGIVFENERNIGYRVMENHELADVGQRAIQRSRTQQRGGLKKMNCAEIEKLDATERVRYFTRRSVLELGLASSQTRTIKNVDQMVMRKHNELTGEEQLAAIKDALTGKR